MKRCLLVSPSIRLTFFYFSCVFAFPCIVRMLSRIVLSLYSLSCISSSSFAIFSCVFILSTLELTSIEDKSKHADQYENNKSQRMVAKLRRSSEAFQRGNLPKGSFQGVNRPSLSRAVSKIMC